MKPDTPDAKPMNEAAERQIAESHMQEAAMNQPRDRMGVADPIMCQQCGGFILGACCVNGHPGPNTLGAARVDECSDPHCTDNGREGIRVCTEHSESGEVEHELINQRSLDLRLSSELHGRRGLTLLRESVWMGHSVVTRLSIRACSQTGVSQSRCSSGGLLEVRGDLVADESPGVFIWTSLPDFDSSFAESHAGCHPFAHGP